MSASADDCHAVVQRHFDDVLNTDHPTAMDELYTEDVIFHGPEGILHGIGPVKEWVSMMHTAFEGFRADVEFMVVEGDRAAVRATVRALHRRPYFESPASERRIALPMMFLIRTEKGRIAELESIYDSRLFAEQLGDTFPLLNKL